MRKTYIDTVPQIYAEGGNLIFTIEETKFYVPWSVVVRGLAVVNDLRAKHILQQCDIVRLDDTGRH